MSRALPNPLPKSKAPFMVMSRCAVLAALIILSGCGDGASSEGAVTARDDAREPPAEARSGERLGSVDFAISGKTVGAKQDQCELSFVVSNNSREEVKNLYVEFTVSDAASGTVLRADEPLVVPGKIPPGKSQAPFGPIYITGLACADVRLQPRDLVKRHCRKDCVPFRYSASGIAGLE